MQQEGPTILEIYKQLEDMSHVLVVRKYLHIGFPHAPGNLQAIYCLACWRWDARAGNRDERAVLLSGGDQRRANGREGGFTAMRTRAQRLLNAVQRPGIYEEALIEPSGVPIALSIWKGVAGALSVVFLPGTMTHPLFYEEFLNGLVQAEFNLLGVQCGCS